MLAIVPKIAAMVRDRTANVALMTAICAVPLFGMSGLAIDYAVAISTKARLDAAADAAAIAAITKAQSVITANAGVTGTALTQGQTQAQAAFKANAGSLAFANVPVPTVAITRTGQTLAASVHYATLSQNHFGQLFNLPTSAVGGTSASSLQMPTYIGVYMALDISQSMGIGASQTDMNSLAAVTTAAYGSSNSCVFGCHVPMSWQTTSNETLAHSNNIQLRIDVLRQAVQQDIADAITSENGKPLYQIGLYTIGGEGPSPTYYGLNTLIAPTTNLTAVQNAASQIDLGANYAGGIGDSNFANAFVNGTPQDPQPFNAIVPASGDGTSLSQAINYAMIITDGVQDVYGTFAQCNGHSHCTQAFDPTLCASLKAKGVIVQVLYTTYIPFPSDSNYQALVAPFASQIQPNLQACATSAAYFYQASDTAGITAAMKSMFTQALQSARIIN